MQRELWREQNLQMQTKTKESHGTGKYPLSPGVLLRGAEGHSNSKETKLIQLIRKESLHNLQERKTSTRESLSKPQPRKNLGKRGVVG